MTGNKEIDEALEKMLGRAAWNNISERFTVPKEISALVGVVSYLATQLEINCSDKEDFTAIINNVLTFFENDFGEST